MKKVFLSKTRIPGFTFIEILLSIALMGILFGIMIPVYQSMQNQNNLSIAIEDYRTALSRAQTLSMSGESNTSWGVFVSGGIISLFQGSEYNSRDVDFDEINMLPVGITASGITEFVFEKVTGIPTVTGTTVFTNQQGDTKSITVNTKGVVNVN